MFDDNDEAKRDDGRIAALNGSVRRRDWSAAEKAAVVKETLVPGVCVSDVARGWQLDPQQVYRWRHQGGVTHGKTVLRASQAAAPAFVPIVRDVMPIGEVAPVKLASLVIEVSLAGAVVRVVSGLDDAHLTAVLRAVHASASRS